jgi:hypothetical protein
VPCVTAAEDDRSGCCRAPRPQPRWLDANQPRGGGRTSAPNRAQDARRRSEFEQVAEEALAPHLALAAAIDVIVIVPVVTPICHGNVCGGGWKGACGGLGRACGAGAPAARSKFWSSPRRSRKMPRHVGQESIPTPLRSVMTGVSLSTGQRIGNSLLGFRQAGVVGTCERENRADERTVSSAGRRLSAACR